MARVWTDGGGIPLNAANLNGIESDIAAKAPAALALLVLPYSTIVPQRPAYPGPVAVQIPDSLKSSVSLTGTTAGGAGFVNGLDFIWTTPAVVTYPPSYGTFGTYKPSASTTGVPAGTALTVQTGDITVTVDGTVLDSLDIHGKITVRANNVTIQRCRVRGPASSTGNTACIDCNPTGYTGTLIRDCDLIPDTPSYWLDAVIGSHFTMERCHGQNTVDGGGSYVTGGGAVGVSVSGCLLESLAYFTPDPNHTDNHTHNDGWQHQGGTGLTLVGNVLVALDGGAGNATSPYYPATTGQALLLAGNVAAGGGHLIDRNWFSGGQQHITIPSGSAPGGTSVGTVTGNRFARNSHSGRQIVIDPTILATGLPTTTGPDTAGNVFEDDGTPVTVTVTTSY